MSCDDDKIIIVIGGGIAGISCIEALFQDFEPKNSPYRTIVLISESGLIKRVNNYVSSGRQLERFDVAEENVDGLSLEAPKGLCFKHIIGTVQFIDHDKRLVVYSNGRTDDENGERQDSKLQYNILCLCQGSRPRQLNYPNHGLNKEVDERIIVIRDTNTVIELREKLKSCRHLVIVGNGGIGLELVSKIANCHKSWIIRDPSIGSTYFDSGAAKFFEDSATNDGKQFCTPDEAKTDTIQRRDKFTISNSHPLGGTSFGPALGPNWTQDVELSGTSCLHKLDTVYEDEVIDVVAYKSGEEQFPLRVLTRKSKQFECDMIVTAIGVMPNKMEIVGGVGSSSRHLNLETSLSDGGVLVDTQMRTSLDKIYAAGDVVSCERWPTSELWFQMRLWTQARQMGYYAGRCISAHLSHQDPSIYFNFDCFTHCTSFFGYKLVLLGKFNGQHVEKQFEVIARVEPGQDYVKILVGKDDGRIIGAVLVGDSGLEETIENLIHDQIDVSPFKGQLLDNTIDIEDYFD